MANGNGPWKTIAIALLTALLSGAGVLILGATKGDVPPDLSEIKQRITVVETNRQGDRERMDRIEQKVDRVLDLLTRSRR